MSTFRKQEDIITGMDDLFRMKEMLQQPEHYTERHFRSECMSCAFRGECQSGRSKKGNDAEEKYRTLKDAILHPFYY